MSDDGENNEQPPENQGAIDRLEQLVDKVVKRTFGSLLDSGKVTVREGGRRGGEDGPNIGEQVKAAVKAAQEEDRRTQAEKDKDSYIEELERKLAGQEKSPRDHRPIHTIMGWVNPDDE